MSYFFKTKNLYIIKIAKYLETIDCPNGANYSLELINYPQKFIAKKIEIRKKTYYEILPQRIIISDDKDCIDEIFVFSAEKLTPSVYNNKKVITIEALEEIVKKLDITYKDDLYR